ncbi:MAG: phage holin family protein [Rhodoferax sp.]
MKLLAKWLLHASALLALTSLYTGVEVGSFGSALIAALVIGLFNTVLRPLLVLLTLPVTVLSLGLFLLVINALLFWAAASILEGFQVAGFGAAFVGSLLYTLMGMVINLALERLFAH